MEQQKDTVYNYIKFIKSSFLDAFYGMRNLKESNGQNPDDCMYVNMAWNRFVDSEKNTFITLTERLLESLKDEKNGE